jgi:hypothetical protein
MDPIVVAAVRVGDRQFIGPWHSDAWALAGEAGYTPSDPHIEGFVTERGQFLTREQANAKLAA